jgi:hypothetical protein
MILACSLVLPAASSSQGRGRAKKGQTAVKSEEEDMQADPSNSQPDAASQQEAEMEVAAVLTAGVDLTEDADETAVPLLDRLAGMLIHADSAESPRIATALQHHLCTCPQLCDSIQVHASNHALS